LRHALGQVRLDLAIGLDGLHVGAELVAGLVPFHRLFQARDDVAVADQDRQRAAPLGGLQRLATLLGDGVVEQDDAVFFDFHGGLDKRATRVQCAGSTTDRWRRGLPPQPAAFKLSTVTKAAHYPGNTAPTPARRRRVTGPSLLFLLLAGTLLAACGGSPDVVRRTPPPENPRQWPVVPPGNPVAANAVLMRAISLVGTPYLYGGNTPQAGFDCSGLVNYVYDDMLDIKLPRTSRAL